MLLFFQVLLTMFIAELGDKTQLLMIAMTSRFKLRDIILGSAAAILVLNALAVGVGAVISQFIPGWVIKIIAALAFFYFAWSTLKGDDEDEESKEGKANVPPILTVFATFFLAELGDKTAHRHRLCRKRRTGARRCHLAGLFHRPVCRRPAGDAAGASAEKQAAGRLSG